MKPETDAAVSYYGVAIQARLDQIDEVRCPLLLHLAEDDHLCPPEAQEAIEREAAGHADGIHVMCHPGVGHAFARRTKIGRALCRDRVCQYVWISVCAFF